MFSSDLTRGSLELLILSALDAGAERVGERGRRFYTLMPGGRAARATQRKEREAFAAVVNRVTGGSHA